MYNIPLINLVFNYFNNVYVLMYTCFFFPVNMMYVPCCEVSVRHCWGSAPDRQDLNIQTFRAIFGAAEWNFLVWANIRLKNKTKQ